LNANEYGFLIDGGEAAQVIKAVNWSQTPVGDIALWPQSLSMVMPVMLHSHVPMFIVWEPACTLLHNNASQPLFNANADQTIGKDARNALAGNWPLIDPLLQLAMQGKPVTRENIPLTVHRAANMVSSLFTISCVPLYNNAGDVGGVMAMATETALLVVEELRQSEERYLRMTNEVEDYAIILLSREGYIENWNKGAEKIKGYSADEILGKHFSLFYTHEDQQKGILDQLIHNAGINGKSNYEGWRVRKDGSTFWGYTVITALHNDKNEVTGFSKVTRDLTERKIADDRLKMYAEQLEEKNRELERSNTELSSFSYVASHDLQEPLRKIQAFGNLIQARDAKTMSDVSRDYFDRMVKAAVRMQNLIDSLLEFSRTATEEEGNRIFDALSKDGKVHIPFKKQFWGGFHGNFVDKYGIRWMVNCR